MRDIVHRTSQVSSRSFYETYEPHPLYPYHTGSSTGTQVTAASGRDDVKSSNHVLATNYRAYRITIRPQKFKYCGIWRWSAHGWRRHCTEGFEDVWIHYCHPGMTTTFRPIQNSGVESRAINKALGKVNESKLDLGETLGESRKSGHMIAQTLVQLIKAFNAARRGRFSDAARILGLRNPGSFRNAGKSVANFWLSIKYGWLPLMSDIFNARQSVIDAYQRQPIASVEAVDMVDNPYFGSNMKGSGKIGCQVGISYKVANSHLAALNQLGAINPLLIAWNLLPLSFVVDWFVSIGKFLEGLSAPIGLEFRSGYKTFWVRNKFVIEDQNTPFDEGEYPSWDVGNFCMERIPIGTFPTPGMAIMPGLNTNRALTSLALLAQRV